MKSELLERLDNYFKSKSQNEIQQTWNEVEKLVFDGPSAVDYINALDYYYKVHRTACIQETIKNLKKMASNYSGSFFFL